MFESKAKRKIKELVKQIGFLSQNCSEKFIEAFGLTEKQAVEKFIADTEEYIEYNEWGLGLETLLENLYEISFSLDEKAIQLAKEALQACEFDLEKWKFIDELKEE
jgi:hypothetical protein